MKKLVKIIAGIVTLALALSVCSCKVNESAKTSLAAPETTVSEGASRDESPSYSDNAFDIFIKMTVEVIGQDLPTAQKKIGEFFGIEIGDADTAMFEERGDVSTHLHVYVLMLNKDNFRFNGMKIWTDSKDGHVRCVEYVLSNSSYTNVDIGDTPEVRSEIKQLNENFKYRLFKIFGVSHNSDVWAYDEDSTYYDFKANESCLIRCGIRDFTEEGGNDLLSTELAFSDCKEYLPY